MMNMTKKLTWTVGLFALTFLALPWGQGLAKCGKHCKGTKANKKGAELACKTFKKKYKGAECVLRKQKLCKAGWRTLKIFKKFGSNYRTCIRKDFMKRLNMRKAAIVCKAYKNKYNRPCNVVKGSKCGNGWRKVKAFGKSGTMYRACRLKKKNETLRKVKNALNSTRFLVHAYKMYFRIASKGASTSPLPASIRRKYQKYFRLNLGLVRYGTSSGLKSSGMTDCYKIYFKPHRNMPAQIVQGYFDNRKDEIFFLHELTHTEQCYQIGGRSNYGMKWFRHVSKGLLRSIKDKKKINSDNIHARMPMEDAARSKSVNVYRKVKNNLEDNPSLKK